MTRGPRIITRLRFLGKSSLRLMMRQALGEGLGHHVTRLQGAPASAVGQTERARHAGLIVETTLCLVPTSPGKVSAGTELCPGPVRPQAVTRQQQTA